MAFQRYEEAHQAGLEDLLGKLEGGLLPTAFAAQKSFGHKVTALTPSSTVSVDPTLGDVFTLTPAQDETINAASVVSGQELVIVITTSGGTSRTLTFSTNFKVTGTLATGTSNGKVFTIHFISDGTNYNELSRTTAM
jgi:hypothetical protein